MPLFTLMPNWYLRTGVSTGATHDEAAAHTAVLDQVLEHGDNLIQQTERGSRHHEDHPWPVLHATANAGDQWHSIMGCCSEFWALFNLPHEKLPDSTSTQAK